jgi:hypothetical protein
MLMGVVILLHPASGLRSSEKQLVHAYHLEIVFGRTNSCGILVLVPRIYGDAPGLPYHLSNYSLDADPFNGAR